LKWGGTIAAKAGIGGIIELTVRALDGHWQPLWFLGKRITTNEKRVKSERQMLSILDRGFPRRLFHADSLQGGYGSLFTRKIPVSISVSKIRLTLA
jgi:hypothetical protein